MKKLNVIKDMKGPSPMKRLVSSTIGKYKNQPRLRTLGFLTFVLVFASIGVYLLVFSRAATPYVSLEAETGATEPATIGSDSNASPVGSGKYVQFGYSPVRTTPACSGVSIAPSTGDGSTTTLQNAIAANPAGTVFCLKSGTHRIATTLTPKSNQQFIGENGAIISGAIVISGFVQEGSDWVANYAIPTANRVIGTTSCESNISIGDACKYPEQVIIDKQPLKQVLDRTLLQPGRFYYDSGASKLYIRDSPIGKTVEGTVAKQAIKGSASITGVKLQNLIVEMTMAPIQDGGIDTNASKTDMVNWIIDGVESRYHHGRGISADGGSRVTNSNVRYNGQMGFGGKGKNILIENTEIAFNDYEGVSCGFEAGAGKWANTDGLILRGNYVHDNDCMGLWTDINNINTLVENNYVINNGDNGIMHEISYKATIRNNTIIGNGMRRKYTWLNGSGIFISASPDVEVYGNLLEGNVNGIGAQQQDRGTGTFGPYEISNLNVHDNIVKMTTPDTTAKQVTGLVADVANKAEYWDYNIRRNRFSSNTYYQSSQTNKNFAWNGSYITKDSWKLAGNDTDGKFNTLNTSCLSSAPDKGTVTTTLNVPTAGTYRLWSRIMAPDSTNNSYTVQVDDQCATIVGDSAIPANQWTWVDYKDGTASSKVDLVNLTAGFHTFKLAGREPGVKVDRILLLSPTDTCISAQPAGNGDNCTTTTDPPPTTDTTAPTTSLTAPAAGAELTGVYNLTANASDGVGVTKVEFYRDGNATPLGTATAPQSGTSTNGTWQIAWDSKTVPDGSYTLIAKAYDAAGNGPTISAPVSVTVKNTTTPTPTQKVTSLTLINADTDQPISGYDPMVEGSTLNLATLPTRNLNIRANTDPSVVGSVKFVHTEPSGTVTTRTNENNPPYAFKGDTSGNYTAWTPAVGAHSLVSTPYTATNSTGTMGTALTVKYNVTDQSTDTTKPSAPTNLTASATSPTSVRLSWTASTDNTGGTGIGGYNVHRRTGTASFAVIKQTTAISYDDLTAAANTTYDYYVTAYDKAVPVNTSLASSTVSVTTPSAPVADTTPPSVPANVTATPNNSSQITVAWSPSTDTGGSGLAGYKVFRNGGTTPIATVGATVTSFGDTGLTATTTYTYTVKAYDAASPSNESAASAPASATTPATTTTRATLTFGPSSMGDATIKKSSPTSNYGSITTLQADNSPVDNFLIKMTVSGVNGRRVVSAKLRLYNTNASVKGGDFYATTSTWVPGTVTWDTAPANGSLIASLGSVAASAWHDVDLTNLIKADGTFSLRTSNTSTDGAHYSSKDASANKPQLILVVE